MNFTMLTSELWFFVHCRLDTRIENDSAGIVDGAVRTFLPPSDETVGSIYRLNFPAEDGQRVATAYPFSLRDQVYRDEQRF